MQNSTANQACASARYTRIQTIALPLLALLVLSIQQHLFATEALSLEGHTGLWNIPSAMVMPDQNYAVSWNKHHNDSSYNRNQNLMIGAGVLPGFEAVFRYGFPDLSLNLKYGRCLDQFSSLQSATSEWNTCAAMGIQDLWGGASFFHSKYVVLSQRLPGGVWAHIGWGSGPRKKSVHPGSTQHRLDGFFAGTELPLFPWPGLQDSTKYNSRIKGIVDYDRTLVTAGLRSSYLTPWFVLNGDISRNMNSDQPFDWKHNEYSMQLRLPLNNNLSTSKSRSGLTFPALELIPVPDLNSYLGTEVGLFDYQLLLDADAILTFTPALRWCNRVEFPLHHTENLEDGKAFAYRRRDDINWESSLFEWAWTDKTSSRESFTKSSGFSSMFLGGFVDYDWGGAFLFNEFRMGPWVLASSAGAFRQEIPGFISEPSDESAKTTTSQTNSETYRTQLLFRVSRFDAGISGLSFHLQAGRFFLAQDYGARFITRRRTGPLEWEAIAGMSTADIQNWTTQDIREDLHFTLEGRMRVYFDLSTPETNAIVLRAPKSWSYGFRTELSREHGDHNRIRTSPLRTADVPGEEARLW